MESFKGMSHTPLSMQGARLFIVGEHFDKVPEMCADCFTPRIIAEYLLGKDAKWSNSKE